jgi:hypothetical protein
MIDKILKIIHHAPSKSEPIYQLESEYKSLSNDCKKKDFLYIIKSLALNGSDKEKFIGLTTIEFLDKAKECEEVIKSNIEEFVFEESEKLIPPLLPLCARLSVTWAIDFIIAIIKYYKPKSNEYSYFFDIGMRSIVSTPHWKEVFKEIKWTIENYDDDYIIDFIAYFKWKRGNTEFQKLFQLLGNNNFLIKKVNILEIKIKTRFINNYGKLS